MCHSNRSCEGYQDHKSRSQSVCFFHVTHVESTDRSSEHLAVLEKDLMDLGATRVLTYDDLPKRTMRDCVQQWTGGRVHRHLWFRSKQC
jgi:hypothetical protein